MAAVQGRCPKCRERVSFGDLPAGAKMQCPGCKTSFKVPSKPSESSGNAPLGDSPNAPADKLRQTIGRYQIRKQVGKGAFGTVYLAVDPNLGREVAVKVLQPHALRDAKVVKRFQREAKVVAGLLHPHIVPVYDFADFEGGFYIVSAFIKGQSLQKAIHDRQLDQAEAVRLTIQLLDALGHAHEQGILHRDVKPLNAQLDEKGELFLMDFGLAGMVEQQDNRETRDGSVLGTPWYMAPEQAEGQTEAIGPEADQYSAAVVLYEMLTGRVPFEANNVAVVMYHVAKKPPPRPSEYRSDIDSDLEAMCLKALAKKPSERWPSCKAFADALRDWQRKPKKSGSGNAATSTRKPRIAATRERSGSGPRKTATRRGKGPWLLVGIVTAVVIAGVGAAILFLPPGGNDVAEVPDSPAKSAGGKPPAVAAKPTAANFAIRLFVPHKVGDVREVKLSREVKMEVNDEDGPRFPPKKGEDGPKFPPKKEDGPPAGINEKTTIKGLIRTLEVDARGQETTIELTVDQFDIKHLDGDKGKKGKAIPRGAMAIGKRVGNEFTWYSPKEGMPVFLGPGDQLSQLAAHDYGGLPEWEANRLLGPGQNLAGGGTWVLSKEDIGKRLAEEGLRGLSGPSKTQTAVVFQTGTGKLVGGVSDVGKSYLEVEIVIRGQLTRDRGPSIPATMTFSVRLPRDGSSGPIKRVTRIEGEKGPQAGMGFTSTITTEVDYHPTGAQR